MNQTIKIRQIEEAYDAWGGAVYRLAMVYLGRHADAEDVTQETFLRFLEKGYGERDALPYLYTIARNLCIDEYRKKKHLPLQVLGEPSGEAWGTRGCGAEETGGTGPGNAVLMENVESGLEERVVMAMAVRKALDALEEEEREVILLRYVNQVPVGTMGKILGISRFSVYRMTKSALKHFREALGKEGFYEGAEIKKAVTTEGTE